MTENIATQAARLLIGVFVAIAIALTVIGRDPTIAAKAFVPIFVLLVCVALVIGLGRAALS